MLHSDNIQKWKDKVQKENGNKDKNEIRFFSSWETDNKHSVTWIMLQKCKSEYKLRMKKESEMNWYTLSRKYWKYFINMEIQLHFDASAYLVLSNSQTRKEFFKISKSALVKSSHIQGFNIIFIHGRKSDIITKSKI